MKNSSNSETLNPETNQMYVHPEENDTEIFFSNTNSQGFQQLAWKSKRKGVRTFNGKGEEFTVEGCFPVFISREELEDSGIALMDVRRAFRNLIEGK